MAPAAPRVNFSERYRKTNSTTSLLSCLTVRNAVLLAFVLFLGSNVFMVLFMRHPTAPTAGAMPVSPPAASISVLADAVAEPEIRRLRRQEPEGGGTTRPAVPLPAKLQPLSTDIGSAISSALSAPHTETIAAGSVPDADSPPAAFDAVLAAYHDAIKDTSAELPPVETGTVVQSAPETFTGAGGAWRWSPLSAYSLTTDGEHSSSVHMPLPAAWALRPAKPHAPPSAAAGEPHGATAAAPENDADDSSVRLQWYATEAPSLGAHTGDPSATSRLLPVLAADVSKQAAVRRAFQHSWDAYRAHAWGQDTLKPISKRGDNGFLGMGITITDSITTLAIMNLTEDCDAAIEWVINNLKFDHQENINVFESTIRVVGGLASAWHLTGRRHDGLLGKARELADAMAFAFDSPTGLPFGTIGLKSHHKYNPSWVSGGSTISEVSSLQLELEFLSHATKEPRYALLGRRVMAHLMAVEPLADSLYPMYISPDSGQYLSSVITLGARGDSLYEYLLKQYLLAGGIRAAQTRAAAADVASKSGPNVGSSKETGQGGLGGNAALLSARTSVSEYAPRHKAAKAMWDAASARATAELASTTSVHASNLYACTDVSLAPCSDHPDATYCASHPEACPAFPWYLGVQSDPSSTPGTEASWFTAIFGMYLRSVAGIEADLIRASTPSQFTYIAERHGPGHYDDKMDHLVCFVPGMLALGSLALPTEALRAHHLNLADRLMDTCVNMYTQTATGLAAEITRFPGGGDPVPDPGAKHNLLRPETVESLMVMYRVTGRAKYREAGWRIFAAFERWSRVAEGGYSTIRDVTVAPPDLSDNQESFWLAETLKYLFLLFSDSDTIPLDQYVFNTEAHPLPVFEP